MIASRCIGPGSRIDIVLCEVCKTPSLVCFAPGGHVVSGDRKVMRNAHVLRINRSAQTPRWLCRRCMTLRTFTIIADERRVGSDGLAPVKDFTPAAPWCLSRPVCDLVRSLARSEFLRRADAMEKTVSFCDAPVLRACTIQTHPRDFKDLAASNLQRRKRRKAIPGGTPDNRPNRVR